MATKLRQSIVFIISTFLFSQSGFSDDRLTVFVSIAPQKFFVQQIGMDLIDIQVMVTPGASPATYEPKPRQMVNLSKAKVYFAIGVPFEKVWLKKIAAANPTMDIIHTDSSIEKLPMTVHHHDGQMEVHSKEEEPPKGEPDPHTWLSPPLVKKQAQTILTTLQDMDPSHRENYMINYQKFIVRVNALHEQLTTTFSGKQGLRFAVFHPAWGYFAHTYKLEQIPIEIEGKSPKPSQLKELIEYMKDMGIKVIFVQPQFSTKSAKIVAKELNGEVVFADPMAEDWIRNLTEVSKKFKAALR